MVLASCRKFCPSVLVGRRSSCWASSRMAAGPSSPSDCSGGVLSRTLLVEQVAAAAPLPGAGLVVEHLGAGGLLLRGGVDRVSRPADGAPRAERELVEPVVAGGVDRAGVVRGLALRQGGPVQAVRGRSESRADLGADRGLLGDGRDGDV